MSKRLDEQIKLTANLLNSAAGSCFTIGVVGPLVAVAINLGDAATKVICRLRALHIYARLSLRKLGE